MLLLILAAHAAPDDRFYPGEGEQMLSVGDLIARGSAAGRTGRLLLSVRDPADLAALAALPGVAAITPLRGQVASLQPRPGVDDLALARRLHADPRVRWVHPDLLLDLAPQSVPDDPFLPSEWHIDHIAVPDAWAHATGGGQLIAVLDSGVQTDHPDLSLVLPGLDLLGDDADPDPEGDGHGTAVAGVAAGSGGNGYGVAGIAYGASVFPVRLIGGMTSSQDIYNAFTAAVDAGATVINNSWGFSTCDPVSTNRTFDAMFAYAEEEGRGGLGTVVTFAAGNEGCDISANEFLATPTAIVVAAVERDDTRAWYSSWGAPVDIAAPTGLLTTDLTPGGYGSFDEDDAFADGFGGTSAATPVVSGVAALMLAANPRLTAAALRSALCQTATRIDLDASPYDSEGRSAFYGCGLVDAGAAVAAVANSAPDAPALLTPGQIAYEGRALLSWSEAADADGDVIGYEVEWNGIVEATQMTSLDLSGQLSLGDTVTWRVRAVDPWGPGAWSEERSFVYEPVPVEIHERIIVTEPEGCATAGGAGWVWIAAALAARRRRATA